MTLDKYIETVFEVAKWLEVFNEAGEYIFGEDYEVALSLIGIANVGLSRPLNEFVDKAEKVAKEFNDKRHTDFLKQFGIKLEGNDDEIKPS